MDEAPAPVEPGADRQRRGLRALLSAQILVTLPTLVISLALAYFSFVQADASRKMQRTETWPYVSYMYRQHLARSQERNLVQLVE